MPSDDSSANTSCTTALYWLRPSVDPANAIQSLAKDVVVAGYHIAAFPPTQPAFSFTKFAPTVAPDHLDGRSLLARWADKLRIPDRARLRRFKLLIADVFKHLEVKALLLCVWNEACDDICFLRNGPRRG
jgi:hypothetical protein